MKTFGNTMPKLLQRLWNYMFCTHEHKSIVRKIHGDEVNQRNGKRWESKCNRCGAHIFHN